MKSVTHKIKKIKPILKGWPSLYSPTGIDAVFMIQRK